MSRILLADDDRTFGPVLKEILERDGRAVTLVTDGVEAVMSVLADFLDNRGTYDLALLDINMPRLDGINALRIVKKLNPRMPVITFSGNADSCAMAESVRAGAILCLSKPFAISRLKAEINNHISRDTQISI